MNTRPTTSLGDALAGRRHGRGAGFLVDFATKTDESRAAKVAPVAAVGPSAHGPNASDAVS